MYDLSQTILKRSHTCIFWLSLNKSEASFYSDLDYISKGIETSAQDMMAAGLV